MLTAFDASDPVSGKIPSDAAFASFQNWESSKEDEKFTGSATRWRKFHPWRKSKKARK
jgi:hypothetical protein